ncbi:MAG: hypothetical protein WBE34_10085 [Candidatus Nitrosopolaris sp.]
MCVDRDAAFRDGLDQTGKKHVQIKGSEKTPILHTTFIIQFHSHKDGSSPTKRPMLAWSRLPPRGGFDQFDAQIDNVFAQSDHNQFTMHRRNCNDKTY